MEIEKILLWSFLIISLTLNIFYLISVYKESYKKSFEDPLTKLNNRKFLEEVKKMVEIARDEYDFVFCDIDHFKKINDTYGHDVGDKVLEIAGKKLKSQFKVSKDHIIRYGGEEFLILIKKEGKDNKDFIEKRINKLRKDIEESTIDINGEKIKFTMSFGICFKNNDHSFEEHIKKADEALYNSKNTGRNKITISE